MSATVTIREPLTERLRRRAQQQHVSLETLVELLLKEALSLPALAEEKGDHADHHAAEPGASLEKIVAQIQALPPNPAVMYQGAKVNDMNYIAKLLATPPQDTLTAEEWEQLWPPLERRLKDLNLASDITENS